MFKRLFVTFLCLHYFAYIRIFWLGQSSLDSVYGVGRVRRALFLDHLHASSNGSFQFCNIEDINPLSVIRQIYCVSNSIMFLWSLFQTSAQSYNVNILSTINNHFLLLTQNESHTATIESLWIEGISKLCLSCATFNLASRAKKLGLHSLGLGKVPFFHKLCPTNYRFSTMP